MRNNFVTNYADYTDLGDYMQNNSIITIITTLNIYDNMKNTFITDYANYTDFRDYIKIISPLTTLTTLIFETT